MNKKNVLVQGVVMYIAMIGVGSAAPPFLGPAQVEVINTPLKVAVTSLPPKEAVPPKYPFVGQTSCFINVGSNTCTVSAAQLETFPPGTNAVVLEQISVRRT